MVEIEPFQVELWMDAHETEAKYNVAETCAASISLADLASLSSSSSSFSSSTPLPSTLPIDTTTKLSYGAIRGSPQLRTSIAALYSAPLPLSAQHHLLTTPGAIAANFLVFYTLLRPGDHVIVHYPTYGQLYQVPRSLGAEVSLWRADPARSWQLDVAELRRLIKPDGKTRMLVLNNPNNPTGSVIPTNVLGGVMELARENGIIVLCDEVYRPLFHSMEPGEALPPPPSAIDVLPSYGDVIVTGSLSKAYALAGIRVGWIASRSAALVDRIAAARHFTAISVSMLDERVAAEALSQQCVAALLERNMQLARTNLRLLADFVEAFVEGQRWRCEWVRPVAGTTAFVRLRRWGKRGESGVKGEVVDDEVFCERLLRKTGVLLVPGGRCFEDHFTGSRGEEGRGREEDPEEGTQPGEFAGYIRLGYVCETEVLKEALAQWRRFMEEEFGHVSVWKRK